MQETVEREPASGAPDRASSRNILLLGGSNAGLKDGWAAQLQARAGARAIENRFLGAVGSLYGLMALLKLQREGAAFPDTVIFEYCLNDMLLVDAGVLEEPLIVDTLEAVLDFCAEAGVGLVFVCLEPRPLERRASRKALARVQPLYSATARRSDARCLWLSDIFPEGLTAAHYQDENHLTAKASSRVAGAVLEAIDAGAPVPRRIAGEPTRFTYVDATQARPLGPCRLGQVTTRVFDGPFLEIARGGASFWPGRGLLLGLMLLSTEASGAYAIHAGGRSFRKNARSHMQQIVKNLILLHYTARAISVDGEVEIAMLDDEAKLMGLPEDRTLLAVPATAPFALQTLEIHGVMLWRAPSPLQRLRAYFPRWI